MTKNSNVIIKIKNDFWAKGIMNSTTSSMKVTSEPLSGEVIMKRNSSKLTLKQMTNQSFAYGNFNIYTDFGRIYMDILALRGTLFCIALFLLWLPYD